MKGSEKEKAMKGGDKKLKDYLQVPGTPPPAEKKDKNVSLLETELEHERLYIDALYRENRELEKILQGFDNELKYIKGQFPQNQAGDGKVHADNELWFKYESQVEVNKKLEKERRHLEYELKQIEEQGVINLDSLSQSELILYVKQLERTKTDLTSDLRANEWSLDKQAKDFHHLDEMRKELEAEIRHYDEELAMFRHYKKTSCPSASVTTSRQSLHLESARKKTAKSKDGKKSAEPSSKMFEKRNSLSHEDITDASKSEIMFCSLDESKLERLKAESPTLGFQRRTLKGGIPDNKRVLDPKKGPIKKTAAVGQLPELQKPRSKTPPNASKPKPSKAGGSKVGTDTPRPKSGSPKSNDIKIVVTGDPEQTKVAELTVREKPMSVKEIPEQVDALNKSGMVFTNMKNFENSPPPKTESELKADSNKFSFDEKTLKSLSGIDVIEEEYEEDFDESDSDMKNLSEKYQGKEIAQVKPLGRDDAKKSGSATSRT